MSPSAEFPYVVVGVDGAPSSTRALAWALRWAEECDHRVVAALVVPTITGCGPGLDDAAVLPTFPADQAVALLAGVVTRAGRLAGTDREVDQRVLQGDVSRQLLAEAHAASLLVLGRSARRRAVRWLSTSAVVLSRAGCPVVVVPPDAPLPTRPVPLGLASSQPLLATA